MNKAFLLVSLLAGALAGCTNSPPGVTNHKAVVEDQTDLICRFHPDYAITFVNPAFLRYHRKPQEEILGRNLFSVVSSGEQKKIREIIGSLTPERPVKTFEHESISATGTAHSYHSTIRAIYNADGEAIEFQISSRDINELQQYYEKSQHLLEELQLHEKELETQNEELRMLRQQAELSERNYLDLYDHAPAGYFTLSRASQSLSSALARLRVTPFDGASNSSGKTPCHRTSAVDCTCWS